VGARNAETLALCRVCAAQVSFAELVAVFVLEEMRSPELRKWVEAQQLVEPAGKRGAEISKADPAADKTPERGTQPEVADKQEREAIAQAKYDSWREVPAVAEG
jgi:hypothetical protein